MKLRAQWILAILLVITATFAAADTIKLDHVLPPGYNRGGVYVMPYFITVNGGTPIMVACNSYYNEVSVGQTWTGTVNTWATLGNTMYGTSKAEAYVEAAWLFLQFKSAANPGSVAADINFALWSLFVPDPTAFKSVAGYGGADTWRDAAIAWYGSASEAEKNVLRAGLRIYTPSDTSGRGPQEYISVEPVPEPGTLALLGTGLLTGAGFLRRKFKLSR